MIVAVTLNLSLDVTYVLARLRPGGTNRVQEHYEQAGGKGINVARVLHRRGVPVLATGFAGGNTGSLVERELTSSGIGHRFVRIPGESRRCTALVAPPAGESTEITERGPVVADDAVEDFISLFESLIERDHTRVAVLSGSLPPGVPVDIYARLCDVCTNNGVVAILDTSGPALEQALGARPQTVKPNQHELIESAASGVEEEGLHGEPFEPRSWLRAAEHLRAAGPQEVVVSCGVDGLIAATAEGSWHVRAPKVEGSPVGAGDALVAALAQGEMEGREWRERLIDAAALSAASVASVTAGAFDADVYESLRPRVSIEPIRGE